MSTTPKHGLTFTLEELHASIEGQLERSTLGDLSDDKALQHAVCGLTEEAGEVAGLLKREVYQGKPVSRERWVDEMGDVLWYLIVTARCKGITMDEVFMYNERKLEKRYGTFEPKQPECPSIRGRKLQGQTKRKRNIFLHACQFFKKVVSKI